MKKNKCPKCKKRMEYRTDIARIFSYKGNDYHLGNLKGMYCKECDKVYFKFDEATRIINEIHTKENMK